MNYSDRIALASIFVDAFIALLTLTSLVFVIYSLRQTRQSINAGTYQNILTCEAEDWAAVKSGSFAVAVYRRKVSTTAFPVTAFSWDAVNATQGEGAR